MPKILSQQETVAGWVGILFTINVGSREWTVAMDAPAHWTVSVLVAQVLHAPFRQNCVCHISTCAMDVTILDINSV